MQEINKVLSSLPHTSGVYQFFSQSGEILYVGKSKNLKSRVNSYFSGTSKLNFAKKKMVGQVRMIDYIVTNNETESLILENTLIKKQQPKYNILLKDDKNFLYIKITKESFPKVIKTRISPSSIRNRDGKYFGPYISGYHVEEILKILKKIYGYGVGPHNFFKKKGSYNLDKYIFDGNIQGREKEIQILYREKIREIQNFLTGNTKTLQERLRDEMHEFAKNMQFEEAQKRKVSLEALSSLDTLQVVRDGVVGEYIVIQILEKYENIYVGVIDIKDSKISGYENYEIENNLGLTSQEILLNIIEQKWVENKQRKGLCFLVPENISENFTQEINFEVPQLGAKFELLKLCYKNIYEYAHKKHLDSLSTKSFTKANMQNLLEILGYKQINKEMIFECNDISHLSGTHSVASRSVIENGKKNPKKYKKFRVKTLDQGKIDDFGSMQEIITRRITEIKKIGNYPDLIVIDGGKGQLSAVMKIMRHSLLEQTPQIVSIAKREEELLLPGKSQPIILDKESSELRLIQSLRDEAHRFAISFNRDSRSKSQKKNILESIPGIGPKTRKKILSHYGSVTSLKQIERKELLQVLGKSVTENLENHGII